MSEVPDIRMWEMLKKQADESGLQLVVDGGALIAENKVTKGVYFQARNLSDLSKFVSGYEYGRKDALKSK